MRSVTGFLSFFHLFLASSLFFHPRWFDLLGLFGLTGWAWLSGIIVGMRVSYAPRSMPSLFTELTIR